MSVITEALKKAEEDSKKKAPGTFAQNNQPAAKNLTNQYRLKTSFAHKVLTLMLWVLSILILSMGFIYITETKPVSFLKKLKTYIVSLATRYKPAHSNGIKDRRVQTEPSDNELKPLPPPAIAYKSPTQVTEKTDITEEKISPVKESTASGETVHSPPPSVINQPDIKIQLNGIMYSGSNPLAIINDTIVEEGDIIGNVKVASIQPKSVVLEKDGKPFVIKLK